MSSGKQYQQRLPSTDLSDTAGYATVLSPLSSTHDAIASPFAEHQHANSLPLAVAGAGTVSSSPPPAIAPSPPSPPLAVRVAPSLSASSPPAASVQLASTSSSASIDLTAVTLALAPHHTPSVSSEYELTLSSSPSVNSLAAPLIHQVGMSTPTTAATGAGHRRATDGSDGLPYARAVSESGESSASDQPVSGQNDRDSTDRMLTESAVVRAGLSPLSIDGDDIAKPADVLSPPPLMAVTAATAASPTTGSPSAPVSHIDLSMAAAVLARASPVASSATKITPIPPPPRTPVSGTATRRSISNALRSPMRDPSSSSLSPPDLEISASASNTPAVVATDSSSTPESALGVMRGSLTGLPLPPAPPPPSEPTAAHPLPPLPAIPQSPQDARPSASVTHSNSQDGHAGESQSMLLAAHSDDSGNIAKPVTLAPVREHVFFPNPQTPPDRTDTPVTGLHSPSGAMDSPDGGSFHRLPSGADHDVISRNGAEQLPAPMPYSTPIQGVRSFSNSLLNDSPLHTPRLVHEDGELASRDTPPVTPRGRRESRPLDESIPMSPSLPLDLEIEVSPRGVSWVSGFRAPNTSNVQSRSGNGGDSKTGKKGVRKGLGYEPSEYTVYRRRTQQHSKDTAWSRFCRRMCCCCYPSQTNEP